MTHRSFTTSLLVGAAFGLAACGGGGGGGGVNSMPTPTPTPTPTPSSAAIIEQATTSQEFAVKGATGISTAASDQLRVRYDAVANRYEVQLPSSGTWQRLSGQPGSPGNTTSFVTASGMNLEVQAGIGNGYDYSALAYWFVPTDLNNPGAVAFGIPTPAGGVPITGSATFAGNLFGQSNEPVADGVIGDVGIIYGTINLGFNFGAGTLSGSMSPILYTNFDHVLPTMQFTNTIYSTGSTTFSGQFVSTLAGANSFSGRFTGPAAQELIGSFAFPYKSPVDSKDYQAAGAFVAKKQ